MTAFLLGFVAAIATFSIPGSYGYTDRIQNLTSTLTSQSSLLPKCNYENLNASCCVAVGVIETQELCTMLQIDLNRLSLTSSLVLNNQKLIEEKTKVGVICYPAGSTSLTGACLEIYWVEMDLKNKKFVVCVQASVSMLASVDFQCIQYENELFSRNSDIKPTSSGLLNVKF